MSNEIALQNQTPDWMIADKHDGTEEMSRFVVFPRLVIVQPTAKDPLDKYDAGTPVIMPNETVLSTFNKAEKCLDEPFIIVPIFFFAEYTLDNPREVWTAHGRVRERSFDHDSELARKCNDWNARSFPCPEMPAKECVHTTRLNFILWLHSPSGAFQSTPCMFSFKRAETRSGMAFNSLIKARNAPIYGCQFYADVGHRSNDKGQWYGLDISNPPAEIGPWVANREMYESYKEEHIGLRAAHESKLIAGSETDELEDSTYTAEAAPEM